MNIQDQPCSKSNLNDLGNKLIYFTRDSNLFTYVLLIIIIIINNNNNNNNN